jgi:hypothetical protein
VNPGPEAGELGGLFVDVHLKPGLLQQRRSGCTAQTRTDDGDFFVFLP